LIAPATPPEPPGLDDGRAAALLDMAEEIVNSAGARVRAEVAAEREASVKRGRLRRLFRRR
jgi:hypothetical protein